MILQRKHKEHNPNWPRVPDHTYIILIIGSFGFGKTDSLFNLISHQPDIDKIYLYAKDAYEAKYQFLIKKRESAGFKTFNYSKLLVNTQMIWMMLANIVSNKNLNTVVNEWVVYKREKIKHFSCFSHAILFCFT